MHKINKLTIASVMALFLVVAPSTSYAFPPLGKLAKEFMEWIMKKNEPDNFIPPEKPNNLRDPNDSLGNTVGNSIGRAATRSLANCRNQYNNSRSETELKDGLDFNYVDSQGLKIPYVDDNLEIDPFGVIGDEETEIADSELCDYSSEIESQSNKRQD